LEQQVRVEGTVVDLPALSANFPPTVKPELVRENVVSTIRNLLDELHGVAVEGPEGMGKSTVLAQFAKAHPATAISVFVSSASRLSSDPDLIRMDITKQIHWILEKDVLATGKYDPSLLKSYCSDLHRDARRKKVLYYFIVDGLEELESETRENLLQQFVDILPTGNHQFRFLFSGDVTYFKGLIQAPFEVKSYPLTEFSIEETQYIFSGQSATATQLKDIRALCGGLPGRMASVLRSLKNGMEVQRVIDETPVNRPEFFKIEWRQVPENDDDMKRILAVLALDAKPHTPKLLSEVLKLPVSVVEEKLQTLNFLLIEPENKHIHFASVGLRSFVASKLADRKRQVQALLIKRLMAAPQSKESILNLPEYLEESDQLEQLLDLLTPEQILGVLERSQTLSNVEDTVQRGVRSAKSRGRDSDLLRFSIQSSVVAEFASSNVWVSEVEALAALGRDEEALALANNSTLREDRLHLLSAFADGVWRRTGKISREITEQIKLLIDRADSRSLGHRVIDISEHLVCASPDLATALLEKVRPTLPDPNDLDLIFYNLSVRALTELKDERLRDEVMERFSPRTNSSIFHTSLKRLRVLSSQLSAKQVLAEVESLEMQDAKIRVLRTWCVMNATEDEADTVAEFALQLALRTTAYTLDATLLADLSSPLASIVLDVRRRELVGAFDGLRGTAERLGPSIDYVRLQLSLASAELVSDQPKAEGRLMELIEFVGKIQDLSSKGEAYARFLGALKGFAAKTHLAFGGSLEAQCSDELESVVLLLTDSTADQYTALTGMTSALAGGFLSKALEYASLVNTEARRDAIARDIIAALVHRPIRNIVPSELLQVLSSIRNPHVIDNSLSLIMERYSDETGVPESTLSALAPVVSRLNHMSNSVSACRGLVQAFNLFSRAAEGQHEGLLSELADQLYSRWCSIDVGWIRIDVGFGLAKDLSATSLTEATRLFAETEKLKEEWRITAHRPASTYVASIRLAIRAFSGLLHKRFDTDTDVRVLAALIDVLPSYGERAVLWADVCMRASVAGRQDLAERLTIDYLKPVLENIPAVDDAYRSSVLIQVAPALYRANSTTCLEMLDTIDIDSRDIALRQITRFLLRGRVPTDPQDSAAVPAVEVSHDTLVEVASICKRMNTDWMIYATSRDVAEMFHGTRKNPRVNIPQREDISRRFEAIANGALPVPRQIQHLGFRIVAVAQALRMRQAKQSEWNSVIQASRAIENVADRALVLEAVALSLPSNMQPQRQKLIADARADVQRTPSELDQIERYIGFAEDVQNSDQKLCRELINDAAAVLPHASEDVASQRKRLVDVAFRVDESFAAALIDKFDDDDVKRSARTQLKLLQVRNGLKEAEPESAVTQVNSTELRRFGWLLVTALDGRRIQSFHPSLIRSYLEVAASQPLRRSFPLFVWYVENAVARFGETNEATTFLRPIFDATVFGAQLAGHIAGRTLTRLKALKQKSSHFGTAHALLVTPGSREEAKRTIAAWLERNPGEFVKITDPYFSPTDLGWLQLIREANPKCEITVLTSKHSQPTPSPGIDLEDVYLSTWRQMFDQRPPKVKIAVIGGENSRQSPIHDRWLLTPSTGLRVGTSLNSLGLTKDSEISELSIDDAERNLSQLDQYLDREKTEHNGERLRLSWFWLA
jgi:hypothetical protein